MTAVLRHVWNCLKHNDLIANENVLKVEFDEEMDVLNGFVTRDLCKKNVLFESVASGNKTRREQKQNKTKQNKKIITITMITEKPKRLKK